MITLNYAKTKFVAASAPDELVDYIKSKGYSVSRVEPLDWLPVGISDHPDLRYCRLGVDEAAPLAVAPSSSIREEYPSDIPYNAACTGRYLICNAAFTAAEILDFTRSSAQDSKTSNLPLTLVDVKQGYAKCSVVIVDERSIITYDRGIAKSATSAGLDVLLVEPGHVELRGYNTGFIGGASGRVGGEIIFNGDLSAHPDFEAIRLFIEERCLKCVWFEGWPLTDIGSIV